MLSSLLLLLLGISSFFLFGDRGAISSASLTGDAEGSILYEFDISISLSGLIYAFAMVNIGLVS